MRSKVFLGLGIADRHTRKPVFEIGLKAQRVSGEVAQPLVVHARCRHELARLWSGVLLHAGQLRLHVGVVGFGLRARYFRELELPVDQLGQRGPFGVGSGAGIHDSETDRALTSVSVMASSPTRATTRSRSWSALATATQKTAMAAASGATRWKERRARIPRILAGRGISFQHSAFGFRHLMRLESRAERNVEDVALLELAGSQLRRSRLNPTSARTGPTGERT